MLRLAAFADEISPELDEQIRVCQQNSVQLIELRGVRGVNVMDFDKSLRAEIRQRVHDAGMGIACIGSPVGKVKISDPWAAHFDRFKLAVELAQYFEAPLVRIFSYFNPDSGSVLEHREEVLRRMQAKVDYIRDISNVTLVHENERHIYGEKGAACLDILKTINSPKLRAAFDFANFVQAGERPLDNWPMLKPYTVHIHIKDALLADGKVVPAGQGDGQIEPILADAWKSGYRGILTLEPHLSVAGQFSGFTGPALFKVAADALKGICRKNGIALAGV